MTRILRRSCDETPMRPVNSQRGCLAARLEATRSHSPRWLEAFSDDQNRGVHGQRSQSFDTSARASRKKKCSRAKQMPGVQSVNVVSNLNGF